MLTTLKKKCHSHAAWRSYFSFLQHLCVLLRLDFRLCSKSRSHAAWRSFFFGVLTLRGSQYFHFCNTSAAKLSILAPSVRISFPCCVALVFFWRPHPAWESIFSFLQYLCSENDIFGASALPMASCTFQNTKGAAESIHDALRSVHGCVDSIVDVLICAVLGKYVPLVRHS